MTELTESVIDSRAALSKVGTVGVGSGKLQKMKGDCNGYV